jgi:hypothetical protein
MTTTQKLADATAEFLDEIAEKARREKPAVHAAIDAALKSGESCTVVTIKLLPGGIQVRATVNAISDGSELAELDVVDAVVTRPAQ